MDDDDLQFPLFRLPEQFDLNNSGSRTPLLDPFPHNATSDPHSTSHPLVSFVINGLGITIIAILGIFGNILSAIVLSRPQMKSSVTCLLLGLAFCDTLLVFISVLIFGLPAISDYTGTMLLYRYVYYPNWVPYLFPVSITAQTGSVYLTLSVTIERYVAVCHPLHARSLCTWSRARLCVAVVLVLAALYNLPRWFEVCTTETEFTFQDNRSLYENHMCPLRESSTYQLVYVNWLYLFVMYVVPFFGLVVFNWAIYQQVRQANRARALLSRLQRREMGLATMLLFVVSVFLLCNVLPLVNNILESFYSVMLDQLVQISNFLVVFNSSANFVIYCTCGARFRRLLLRLYKDFMSCQRHAATRRRDSHSRSRTTTTTARSFKRRMSPRCFLRRGDRAKSKSMYVRSHHPGDDDIEFEELSLGSIGNNGTCTMLITPTTATSAATAATTATAMGRPHHGTLVLDLSSQSHNRSSRSQSQLLCRSSGQSFT